MTMAPGTGGRAPVPRTVIAASVTLFLQAAVWAALWRYYAVALTPRFINDPVSGRITGVSGHGLPALAHAAFACLTAGSVIAGVTAAWPGSRGTRALALATGIPSVLLGCPLLILPVLAVTRDNATLVVVLEAALGLAVPLTAMFCVFSPAARRYRRRSQPPAPA